MARPDVRHGRRPVLRDRLSLAQSEEAEELLFGAPVAAGRLHIVYRNPEGDADIDYLLHHPDWDRSALLARDDGHFMDPGVSWPELAAVADNGLGGGSTTGPGSRLLLPLPAFGDAAVPVVAVERLATALRARTAVENPEQLAAVLLEGQGPSSSITS